MKLEEEIKSRFRNNRHKAGINLIYTANHYNELASQIVKGEDISLQQYNTLRILRGSHPKSLSVKDIRERMLDKMSDVSRIVEKLREKGFLHRTESKEDRRNVDINISEKGLQLLHNLDDKIIELDSYFNHLTDEEIDMLNILLDKIRY